MKRRTLWFLVAAVVAIALGTAMVGALALFMRGGARGSPGKGYLVINAQGELPEIPAPEFGSWFEHRPPALPTVLESLDRAARDSNVAGVVIRVGLMQGTGWARTEELRDALIRFKQSGKPVYAHISDFCGNKEYYLATAATKIFAISSAHLNVSGLAAEISFYRETLAKIGVEAQFEAVGKYKSAPDTYTKDALSQTSREQLDALLDDLSGRWIAAVAKARNKTPDEVRSLIDGAPYDGRLARQVGLVDDLLYADEVEARLKGGERLTPGRYARASRGFGLGSRPRIALIYVVGDIVSGESDGGPFSSGEGFAGSETVVRALRQAREDSGVKAVVLRVDSPGGSATASDQIWHELRRTAKVKPVIASMGDYAASGGYYVAMGAHAIVAEPNTITGSIGVFSGKFNLKGLYEKLGIHSEVLLRGRRADIYGASRPWTDEERAHIRSLMESFYREFVAKAAESRNRKPEEIAEVAQGRVWSGQAAVEIGLVDKLGGLDDAIDLAREKAKLGKGEAVTLVVMPQRKSFFDLLMERPEDSEARLIPENLRALLVRATLFLDGRPAALMPYQLSIQ